MTRRIRRSRLCLETLERRLAPATFDVTNIANDGAGSLRQAILDANGTGGQDTINFQAGLTGTIPLAATLSITDSVIINGPGAGALSVSGQNTVRPFTISNSNASAITVLIFDMTITNGRSMGADGGGVFTDNEAVRLDRVVVSNCTTTGSGGGVGVGGGGVLFLQDSTITGNSAIGGTTNRGGGVYFFSGGALNMQGCTLVNNSATGTNGGGGLYFFGAPSASYGGVTVSNCTITGNTAPIGGGIALRSLDTAANPVTMQNSTITGNTATTTSTAAGYGGGGLSVVSSAGRTVRVRSTVLSGNTATAANGRSDIATIPELTVNNTAIGDTDGVNLAPGSGSNLINQALFLNSLANNGGPTQTISFAANSPLRNAGSNLGGLATDQRGAGFPRALDGAFDIGAFEANFPVVANLNDSGTGSLRQALLDSNASLGFAEVITFQPGLTGTITLVSQLTISDNVSILGPGASVISVSGNNAVRVFDITDNNANTAIDVAISGLTVTAGRDGPGNDDGGGIRIATETVSLDRVVVSNCNAVVPGFSEGGGIFVGLNGDLIVRNSTITGNTAVQNGGGISVYGGGFGFVAGSSLLVENCTVSNNTSNEAGGGVFFIGDVGAGGITIRNSTIAGNTALNGGGLRLRSLDTTLGGVLIQNSTFTDNRSTNTGTSTSSGGGGLQLTSLNPYAVTMVSTIVSGNTAANGRDDITTESGVTLNVTFSAIGDPDGFTINGTNQNNLPFGTPLGLFPLADNGGPTQTVAFAANSALLNAGANPANLTTDQRDFGFNRVNNGAPDIGAFEATVFTVTNLNDDGLLGSLRLAVQVANLTDDPEFIVFQAGLTGTINLGSTLPITRSVSIAGPGASALTVSGQNANRVFDISGTGVLNVGISGVTIAGGNVASDGAGIRSDDDNLTLDGVVISGNTATGGNDGGGIAITNGGFLTIRNSTISGNQARRGGGIYFFSGGGLLLENSTVSGNTATESRGGGGLYFFGEVAAGFALRNSTFANNTAPSGGAIALRSLNTAAAPILIQNSTITGNTSTTTSTTTGYGGGGIALTTGDAANITIVSTIVSGNTASAANGRGDIAIPNSATVNVNFSAIGDPDGFTRSGTSGNNLPDGAALGLSSLAGNGGPTQTIAFAANSPLRNAGSNPAPLSFDQRGTGFPRVFGSAADIGAFELQSAPVPVVSSVVVNAGQANTTQRSRVTTLTVTFSAVMTFAGPVANAFSFTRNGGVAVNFTATANVVGGVTVVTLDNFTGDETQSFSLRDGRYTLTTIATQLSADGQQMAANHTFGDADGLFRMFGDFNGNRQVDNVDFFFFRPALGSTFPAPNYVVGFDFDGNGFITNTDLFQFRLRLGTSLP